MSSKRVVLVDDHPTFRAGLRARLEIEPSFEVCGEADDLASAVRVVEETQPDLAVVDIRLGTDSGIDLVRRLVSRDDGLRILVVSMYEEELYADRALKAGARGYVTKGASTDELVKAIRYVAEGGVYLDPEFSEQLVHRMVLGREGLSDDPVSTLSDRELQVYELIGRGLSTADIAAELHLSVHTIETHRQRIKSKLEISHASELTRSAAQWVLEHG